MTTKYPPLISKSDLQAIHRGNEINRRILQAGLRELVNDVHNGNQQSSRVIRKVADRWK